MKAPEQRSKKAEIAEHGSSRIALAKLASKLQLTRLKWPRRPAAAIPTPYRNGTSSKRARGQKNSI